MTPKEYQVLAGRTECDQVKSLERMVMQAFPYSNDPVNTQAVRVNHAIIGLAGEVGELASTLQKWIYYGQPLDGINLKEEAGDCLWYLAELCNAMGFDMGQIMETNIAKLKARYPAKYGDELAVEDNRDRRAERQAVEYDKQRPHVFDAKTSNCVLCLQNSFDPKLTPNCK